MLLLLLVSSVASASGRISIQPNYWFNTKRWSPLVGLAVYEHIWRGRIAYNGWLGAGEQPFAGRESVWWYTMKHDIDVQFLPRLTISPGVQVNYIVPWKEVQGNVHAKLSVQLW